MHSEFHIHNKIFITKDFGNLKFFFFYFEFEFSGGGSLKPGLGASQERMSSDSFGFTRE